jgi:hypothetical protein
MRHDNQARVNFVDDLLQIVVERSAEEGAVVVKFLLWLLLLVVCWPLALLALVLWPLVWLLTLPFRLIGIAVEGLFALLRAIFTLPARLLGWRPGVPAA